MQQSEQAAAMREVIKSAKKIRNIYRNASEENLGDEISTLCMMISKEHDEVINAIENTIRLPSQAALEPNPDLQTLEEGLTHIRAQLAENTECTLLEELQGYEKQLAEKVAAANQLNLDRSMTQAIDRLKEVISESFRRLSEAKLRNLQ